MSSIWDQLKWGFKIGGDLIYNMGKAAIGTTIAAIQGFESGGPVGAAMAGIPSAISGISTVASRIGSYFHEVDQQNNLPNNATVASVLHPIKPVNTMNSALQTATAQSPDSVQQIAGAAAAFHDGLAKHGNVVSAVKAAGGSPITQHLANNMSNTIVDNIQARSGFNARNAMRYGDSSMRSAQMVGTTSAFNAPILSYMNGGGAEALAMRNLAAKGYGGAQDIVVGGG